MKTVRCVFFGDSITAGQYVPVEFHWTTLLRERWAHQSRHDRGNMDVNFSVAAVSGSTTRQSLERFPEQVQAVAPDVVTIQFGLNDCNRWQTDGGLPRVSPRAFEANLHEMVTRARRFGATDVILSTNHPTLRTNVFENGDAYEECSRAYNDIIRRVAMELGAPLNDIEAGFAPQHSRLAELLLPAPDLLHLSADGHVLYAELLQPLLFAALTRVARARTHSDARA